MRSRLLAAAKYVLYPVFYLFCLFSCLYLTFPWDKLKDRIEAEFAKGQEKKGAKAWRLEIDSLSGYWLSGIEIQGARIIMPPDEEDDDTPKTAPKGALGKVTSNAARTKKAAEDADAPDGAEDKSADGDKADKGEKGEKEADKPKTPKDTVVLIQDAHARVRMLPLIIGRVRLDFEATVFSGQIRGQIPFGGGDLSVEIQDLNLAQIAPLKDVVSVPIKGVANGKLELSAEDGKWSKAAGSFSITVKDMAIGDGKSKFRKLGMTMTPATVGTFEILAKAEAGIFKIEKFGASGQEVELAGEGTLKLKEPWDNSVLDLWLRFGFSEEYKNKDDRTKAMFVDEGPFPALISQDRKLKKALRADGLWGFNIKGKLSRLSYIPTKADGPRGKASGEAPTSSTTSKKKKTDDDDEDTASTPPGANPGGTGPIRRPPTGVAGGAMKGLPRPATPADGENPGGTEPGAPATGDATEPAGEEPAADPAAVPEGQAPEEPAPDEQAPPPQ